MRENPRRRCRLYLAALLVGLLLAGNSLPSAYGQNPSIVVGAAISLKESFNELGGIYEHRTGTKVTFTCGSSGELERQIEAGAPVDVIASAAEKEMDELRAKNLIARTTRKDFARNALVLVVPVDSQLHLQSFSDLQKPGVTKIAIGNPKTVPAGQYAEELLCNIQLWPKVESRLIMGENVRQVLDYVARGEVDAGIVYATAVQVAPLERYGQIKISPVKEKTFKIMAPGYEWRTFWDSFPDSDGLSMPDEFLANVSYEGDNPRKPEKSEVSFDIKSQMGMKWIGGPTVEESLKNSLETSHPKRMRRYREKLPLVSKT